MKQTWNKPIDKHTDWGGDRSTEGLPVSGQYVQKFIKDTLEEKGGYFHSNSDEGVCYVFSDKEAYDTYVDTGEGEPIGQFRIPIVDVDDRYYISTNIKDEEKHKTVLASTTPKTITFNPTLKSGVDNSSIPSILYWTLVIGTYTLTGRCQSGDVVTTQDLSNYVHVGGNNYQLTITAPDTYDSAQSRIDGTITVIDLSFTITSFNYQQIQNNTLSISYQGHSQAPVFVQFIIDNQYDAEKVFQHDIGLQGMYSADKTLDINNLSNGVHTLQARAYISSGTDYNFSNSYYYEFVVGAATSNTALISTQFDTVATYPGYVDYTLRFTIEQYTNLMFGYAIQNPNQTLVDLTFTLDNEQISSRTDVDSGIVYSFQYPPTTYGRDKTVQILINNTVVKEFLVTITKSQYDVQKITEGLVFELEAKGKSNSDADKDSWGTLTPQNFHNFTFSGRKGWDTERGALSIADGAYITIPNSLFTLLPIGLENRGYTIEITLETFNIKSESATIFNYSNGSNNSGLNITATSATFVGNTVSEGSDEHKTEISTKFSDGEKLNLFFIVSPKTVPLGSGLYPSFLLLANNGIYERAVDYSGDTFNNDGNITIGDVNGNCGLYLYNFKVYDRVFTEDEIINNYALDTNNIQEVMVNNSVFEPNSHTFSKEILQQRTPVMYLTCPDIERLFEDKNRESKFTVLTDIDYVDDQHPEFNFSAKNIGLRKQGTSTYTAPVPNLRVYLNKKPGGTDDKQTSVTGTRVIQKGTQFFYSFKNAAQYVDVWTLKADPAESSMTHNTGVARLWGDAFKDFDVSSYLNTEQFEDGELDAVNSSNATDLTGLPSGKKGLTKAQADVLRYNEDHPNDKYEYDVRTTVDGFPIVLFYRLSESLPWTFMGQYNFNNDKSTESVYGWFTSEPTEYSEFVNEDAECWEFRENTFDVTLFRVGENKTAEETFDDTVTGGAIGFEARYPDGNPNIQNLRNFYLWMSQVSQEDFNEEMYDHIDIWKVAAYYVYCMRFGAVDQMVKNAMFCTDDGLHWYFINYDNDTILGVRNDGALVYNYDIDRTTEDTTLGENDAPYVFQGHDSNLWNKLTANETFNKIVRIVDKALSADLISYRSCIRMFNVKQASSWCERIYNYNGEYKYIQPYFAGDTSYLKNLQGSRTSHRTWWLKNRFDIYDSMWQSGNYKQYTFGFLLGSMSGDSHIKVTSGNSNVKYGWGIIQHSYYQTPTTIPYGQAAIFSSIDGVGGVDSSISDAIRIYEAHNLLAIDLSEFNNITELRLESDGSFYGNNMLERLNLSGNAQLNNSLDCRAVPHLRELVITNCSRMGVMNLDVLKDLSVFNASGTTLTEFVPADGVTLSNVVLPSTITRLELNNATISTFSQNSTVNINTLVLNNVAWNDEYNFVMNVLNSHTTSTLQNLTMSLRNINWQLTDSEFDAFLDKYAQIEDRSNLILTGRITLDTIDQELYDKTISILGIEVFQTGGQLVVDCTSTVDLINTIEALDQGDSATLRWIHFPLSVFDTNNTRYTIPGVTPTVIDGQNVYVTQAAKVYEETGVIQALVDNTLTTNTTLSITCINGVIRYNTSITINRCVIPNCVYIGGSGIYSVNGVSYNAALDGTNFYIIKSYRFSYAFVEENVDTVNNDDYTDGNQWNNKKTNDSMIQNIEVKIESYDDPTVLIDPTIAEATLDTTNKRITLTVNSLDTQINGYKLRLYITRTDGVVYRCTWNYFWTHDTKIMFTRRIAMAREATTSTTIDFMYAQGWVADTQIVYVEELEAITDSDLVASHGFQDVYTNSSEICDMGFLQYMTSITTIPQDCFVRHLSGGSTRDPNSNHASQMRNVKFPSQITQVDDYAFYGAHLDSSIAIPDAVIRIGKFAFYNAIGCISGDSSSNKVTFGTGTTILDDRSFNGCFQYYGDITIPATVTQFGVDVLRVSGSRGHITINCNLPDRTVNNQIFTFNGVGNSTGSHEIVINSTSIGSYAIRSIGGTWIILPSNIQKLGDYWLYNIYNNPWSNVVNDSYYYLDRSHLDSIRIGDGQKDQLVLPNSLTSIGEGAFSRTTTVSIIFPSNSAFVQIPQNVLQGCPLLKTVVIPEQITAISDYAFADCYGVREFIFHPAQAPIMGLQAFAGDVGYNVVSQFAGIGNRWSVARITMQSSSDPYSGILDTQARMSWGGSDVSYDSTVQGTIRIPANSTGYTNTGSNTTAIEYLCDMDTHSHFGTYLADGSLSCYQSGSTPATYDKSFILDQTL